MQKGRGLEGSVGTAVQALQFLSGSASRTEWFVQARIDIEKEFDVNKKVQVNIE